VSLVQRREKVRKVGERNAVEKPTSAFVDERGGEALRRDAPSDWLSLALSLVPPVLLSGHLEY
jgi:hypothetical protein